METLVMKFGGAAVATPEHFSHIADIILQAVRANYRCAVVVSAMGGMTDHLISLADRVNPDPPRREYDMLLSVGERISIALLAMALAAKGQEAVSFTGSQSGIITSSQHSDARIIDVRPSRLRPLLQDGKVVIVAGFQGVSAQKEITTLGRGGSDTTAVALAIALGATKAVFYKDVPGVFDKDPKKFVDALVQTHLSYEQAKGIVAAGAKVLHPRCIDMAHRNGLPLQVVSFVEREASGTWIGDAAISRPILPIYEEDVALAACNHHG